MALLTRSTLKNLFKRGNIPTEVNFADLIDSNVNKVDDGFAQSTEHGWMLSGQGSDHKLISFFDNMRDENAKFNMSLNPNRQSRGLSINNESGDSIIFFGGAINETDNTYEGNVGIGTTIPRFKLEVKGLVAMEGRVGIHKMSEVPADGNWHAIIEDLEGMKAYEIFAHAVGKKGRGRYAMTHAVALGMYGKGTIETVKASYGWFFQKIKFRWRGTIDRYVLEMKTAGNYGFVDDENKTPAVIRFYVAKLWDNSMLPDSEIQRLGLKD
jgi:hypothetical protein